MAVYDVLDIRGTVSRRDRIFSLFGIQYLAPDEVAVRCGGSIAGGWTERERMGENLAPIGRQWSMVQSNVCRMVFCTSERAY